MICLKEIIQPHQIKTSYVSGIKMFERRFTGICRHWFSKCSENADLGRLEMVQYKMFFLTPAKINLLVLLQEYTFYTVE